MSEIKTLLDETQLADTLKQLTDELKREYDAENEPALIGIQRRGVTLAARVKAELDAHWNTSLDIGRLDITLHRDDLSAQNQPIIRESHIPFDVTGRQILLVDDVLYTGRSVRAALEAILNYGRPKQVRLLVLVDRGQRELPIQADFRGMKLDTTPEQEVQVCFHENDDRDQVLLVTS